MYIQDQWLFPFLDNEIQAPIFKWSLILNHGLLKKDANYKEVYDEHLI